MKNSILLLLVSSIIAATGCDTYRPVSQAGPQQLRTGPEVITHSLFDSEDRTISEENIQRLLKGKIVIPDSVRIAVYKYGGTSMNRYYSYYWNNEEFLDIQQSYVDSVVAQLQSSGRVEKVFLVPSIMTMKDPNITQLRETAVRLQADMLLVFTVNSDIYYQYKFFQKNEAKAFATCEAILMDTRTGVVPHSSVITRKQLVKKDKEDMSREETQKRAEKGAVNQTLVETGQRVAGFLDRN